MPQKTEPQKPLMLVADTNLFFECKKLEQLPWGDFYQDPVTIVLTKPVLEEIDKHKKSTGRTRERALEIFQKLRSARKNNIKEIIIKENSPRVLLKRIAATKPDSGLKDHLDYQNNDERLLGIASSLSNLHPDATVMFLSHDEGPIGLAEELGLPAHQIEDHWLRPARQSEDQKKIRALENENAKLREQEPKIDLSLADELNNDGKLVFVQVDTASLSTEQVQQLVDKLKDKHPIKTDFTPPEADNSSSTIGLEWRFSPPSEADIEEYQQRRYPDWVSECTSILQSLHVETVKRNASFWIRFRARNVGSRPAHKVKLVVSALGAAKLRMQSADGSDTDDTDDTDVGGIVPKLPPAPKPPKFEVEGFFDQSNPLGNIANTGQVTRGFAAQIANLTKGLGNSPALQALEEISRQTQVVAGVVKAPQLDHKLFKPLKIEKRDEERFYYTDWKSDEIVDHVALTCDLWRHSSDEKEFEFEIVCQEQGYGRSAINCSIHAENLTEPVSLTIPIALEKTVESIVETANLLVDTSE